MYKLVILPQYSYFYTSLPVVIFASGSGQNPLVFDYFFFFSKSSAIYHMFHELAKY